MIKVFDSESEPLHVDDLFISEGREVVQQATSREFSSSFTNTVWIIYAYYDIHRDQSVLDKKIMTLINCKMKKLALPHQIYFIHIPYS